MTDDHRCPACGRWRVVRWRGYLDSPGVYAAVCESTPLGRRLNAEAGRWEDAEADTI